MGHGFSRRRGSGGCTATFSAFEAGLLRSLAAQLVELLRSEATGRQTTDPLEDLLDLSGPTSAPEDPVLARLLPTAYPDDEEAAADFRRFTEPELRNGKVTSAMTVISSLERGGLATADDEDSSGRGGADEEADRRPPVDVELDADAAMSWLRCLTDIRLALATRLGVTDDDEDFWSGLPEDDPRAQVHQIYLWVGFVQETLVDALG